jgi:putative endonuclease
VLGFFMSFIVYIIYSKSLDSFYVGHSANLDDRLFRHNNSGSKSTKKAKDWILVHQEAFPTRGEAMARETAIKKQKSKSFIQQLIKKL